MRTLLLTLVLFLLPTLLTAQTNAIPVGLQPKHVAQTRFVIEPHIRFQGQVGEQATMFFLDPSGNALEFKAFKDMNSLFAR